MKKVELPKKIVSKICDFDKFEPTVLFIINKWKTVDFFDLSSILKRDFKELYAS